MNSAVHEITAEDLLHGLFGSEFKGRGIPVSRYLREMLDCGYTHERAMRDLDELAASGKIRIESGYQLREAA